MSSRTLVDKHVEYFDKQWIQNRLSDQNRNAVADSIVENLKFVGIPAGLGYLSAKMAKQSADAIVKKLGYIGIVVTAAGVVSSISDAIQRERMQSIYDEMDKRGGYVKVTTNTYEQGPQGKKRIVTTTSVIYSVNRY